MIHLASATIGMTVIFPWFWKSENFGMYVLTVGRTDNIWENSDHHWSWLWTDQVDQIIFGTTEVLRFQTNNA